MTVKTSAKIGAEYIKFRTPKKKTDKPITIKKALYEDRNPEELLETAYQDLQDSLASELLDTIANCSPEFIPANNSSNDAKVFYESENGKTSKTFDALEWLVRLRRITHIPNRGEQMVRYYGFYSNKSRGLLKKVGTDNEVPALMESEAFFCVRQFISFLICNLFEQ